MAGTLFAQQSLVALALHRRREGRRWGLNPVDLLTLSRGVSAATLVGIAVSGIRDRRGSAGWMSWLSCIYGAVACDWLDGPLARLLGTSELGEVLDLEEDSWLTLCMAVTSFTQGGLPAVVVAPALVRYAVLFRELRRKPYTSVFDPGPGWSRHLGMMQGLLFIGALAPFGGRATRSAVDLLAPIQTPMQIWSVIRSTSRLEKR